MTTAKRTDIYVEMPQREKNKGLRSNGLVLVRFKSFNIDHNGSIILSLAKDSNLQLKFRTFDLHLTISRSPHYQSFAFRYERAFHSRNVKLQIIFLRISKYNVDSFYTSSI